MEEFLSGMQDNLVEDEQRFAYFALNKEDEPKRIVRVIDWKQVADSRRYSIYIRERNAYFEIEFQRGTRNYLHLDIHGKDILKTAMYTYEMLNEIKRRIP